MSQPSVASVIQTPTHGRYLVRSSVSGRPSRMLVGFHGYKETAEIQMERLASIPGADGCILVSIQGLHRFYLGRTEQVVASWMTREDRQLAMADNTRYVAAVVDAVAAQHEAADVLFSGFSQGVAMAFRAACDSGRRVSGVIALGGDVPPELGREALGRLQHVLLGRGTRDEWYTAAKHAGDVVRLKESGAKVVAAPLDAGHAWTPEFSREAGEFLARLPVSIAI